jgi:hypothetical protein
VFDPGLKDPKAFNLWRGFSVEPAKGKCKRYLAHLFENVCRGNGEHFNYLLNWMARAVQSPELQGEVAVVMRGREGTGKGVAISQFGKLFGQHYLHISQPDHLTGHFNAHLQSVSVLFADEAFFAGDRRHEGVLKALITEPTLMVEIKGVDAFQVRNSLHVMNVEQQPMGRSRWCGSPPLLLPRCQRRQHAEQRLLRGDCRGDGQRRPGGIAEGVAGARHHSVQRAQGAQDLDA